VSARFSVDSTGLTFDAHEPATPIDGAAVVRPPRFALVDAVDGPLEVPLVILRDQATGRDYPFLSVAAAERAARRIRDGLGWGYLGHRTTEVPAGLVLSPTETPIPDADLQEARP